jgi:hypothetical protein
VDPHQLWHLLLAKLEHLQNDDHQDPSLSSIVLIDCTSRRSSTSQSICIEKNLLMRFLSLGLPIFSFLLFVPRHRHGQSTFGYARYTPSQARRDCLSTGSLSSLQVGGISVPDHWLPPAHCACKAGFRPPSNGGSHLNIPTPAAMA